MPAFLMSRRHLAISLLMNAPGASGIPAAQRRRQRGDEQQHRQSEHHVAPERRVAAAVLKAALTIMNP
jgi:hypothetical protein